MSALAWPAAALVGLSLGMLGSGGSILTVPLLRTFVGMSMREATATSLPIVGLVALAGFAAHARRAAVSPRLVAPFALASVPAAFLARLWLAPLVSDRHAAWAFAALMFVVAYRMAFRRVPEAAAGGGRQPAAVAAAGLGVGALTGVLGAGGGFVIVPSLVVFLGFDVRRAIGTSLAVIALNCAAGVAANAASTAPVSIDLSIVALFALAGFAGIVVGTRLAHRLPAAALRRTFAGVVVVTAVWLLARG